MFVESGVESDLRQGILSVQHTADSLLQLLSRVSS